MCIVVINKAVYTSLMHYHVLSLYLLFLQKYQLVNEKTVSGVDGDLFQAGNNGSLVCSIAASL